MANEDHTKLIESVKDFFTQQLEIEETIEIVDAFRLGKTESKPVMIKLTLFNDKALIYSHSKNLKGKKNSKHKAYYILDDTTEEQDEIRRLYKSLLTENDEQVDEQKQKKFNTTKMQRGKVYVNNTVVKQQVKVPTNPDILRMNNEELEQVKSYKIINGSDHIEKGSEFQSYVFKATSVQDVNKAYTKMKVKYADATYISCAYRLADPFGPYHQEAIDDGDYSIGREILNVLKAKEVTEM